jgi:multiple sugar transport system permease protein
MTVQKRESYFFILPISVFIFILTIYPTIYCLVLSLFSTIGGVTSKEFVGLNNYFWLFTSVTFWKSLILTIGYTVFSVGAELIIGCIIALLIIRIPKGKNVYKTLFILPLAVSPAIAALTWRTIYNPSFGVLNYLLGLVGIKNIYWHTGASTALLSVVMVDIWQWTPFFMVILYAALISVPVELKEAAEIDGCSKVRTFFRICIPVIKPVLVLVILFRSLDAFKAFDTIFVLTKGGPGRATETLVITSFIDAFYNFTIGKAAAISIILLIISLLTTKRVLKNIEM